VNKEVKVSVASSGGLPSSEGYSLGGSSGHSHVQSGRVKGRRDNEEMGEGTIPPPPHNVECSALREERER